MNPFNQHDSEPDEALICRFQSGDAKAFDRLVLRYQAMVLRVAYKTLQQEDDAKDAAQEIFVKIYRSLAGFKPQA
ncbi:MAG TPA: sigma factor, partial [bacterium]|nr:sigma factor [bacterium]